MIQIAIFRFFAEVKKSDITDITSAKYFSDFLPEAELEDVGEGA